MEAQNTNNIEKQKANDLMGISPGMTSEILDALNNDGIITVSETEAILSKLQSKENLKQTNFDNLNTNQQLNKSKSSKMDATENLKDPKKESQGETSERPQQTNNIPFPLKNLTGQEPNKIFGIDIKELSGRDLYNLEQGNYTDRLYNFKYENKEGKVSEITGRLYLTKGSNNSIEAKFLPKIEKPDIKEYLNGGYKLKEGEKEALLENKTLVYTNKPLMRIGSTFKRSIAESTFMAKLDLETNQVITRNMGGPFSFKFNSKIYGVPLSDEQVSDLKAAKPIQIENPIFKLNPTFKTRGRQEGTFTVNYCPIRNNLVVRKNEVKQELKQDQKRAVGPKTEKSTKIDKTKSAKLTQDVVKLTPKSSSRQKL
ncbi:MAG: hypothetical protein WBP45_15010 [Daejeonella sp.]